MTLEIIEKEAPFLKEKNNHEGYFNYSNIVIPFSDIFYKIKLLDIYSGTENIPFEERDSEYKKILLNEFL